MEEDKVKNVINIIKDMNIKDKLRLGICLTTSDWTNILYNKTEKIISCNFMQNMV